MSDLSYQTISSNKNINDKVKNRYTDESERLIEHLGKNETLEEKLNFIEKPLVSKSINLRQKR